MELLADDGTRFSLVIGGYQFPGNIGRGPDDWDANWLTVEGHLELPDGRSHWFADPCLTTWEARRLASWLLAVAADAATRTPSGPTITFTEPCLAFGLTSAGADQLGLRVYLSLEAEPPFVVAGQHGMYENYVPLLTSAAAVERVAGDFTSELKAYPVRG